MQERALSRAGWPDKHHHFAALHFEGTSVKNGFAAEFLADVLNLEDCFQFLPPSGNSGGVAGHAQAVFQPSQKLENNYCQHKVNQACGRVKRKMLVGARGRE